MRTGIISKLGVERIGYPTLVARGTSTLFKWKDQGTSEVNVGSEFLLGYSLILTLFHSLSHFSPDSISPSHISLYPFSLYQFPILPLPSCLLFTLTLFKA